MESRPNLYRPSDRKRPERDSRPVQVRGGGLSQQALARNECGASFSHLFEGPIDIARLQVYAAATVQDKMDCKSQVHRVEHRELDAVIGGQSKDEHGVDSLVSQVFGESRRSPGSLPGCEAAKLR